MRAAYRSHSNVRVRLLKWKLLVETLDAKTLPNIRLTSCIFSTTARRLTFQAHSPQRIAERCCNALDDW